MIWLVRLLPHKEQVRLALAWANRVKHLANNQQIDRCLDVVQRWLDGDSGVDLRVASAVMESVSARANLEALVRAAWATAGAIEAASAVVRAAVAATVEMKDTSATAAVTAASSWTAIWAAWAMGEKKVEQREQIKMLVKVLLRSESNF